MTYKLTPSQKAANKAYAESSKSTVDYFTPQPTSGKFNTSYRPDWTLILCTIYATTAIICLVCALVIGIMQAL